MTPFPGLLIILRDGITVYEVKFMNNECVSYEVKPTRGIRTISREEWFEKTIGSSIIERIKWKQNRRI